MKIQQRIVITGSAGFIGMHTSLKLLARGDRVLGIDNLNDYYDVRLKQGRLQKLKNIAGFEFVEADLCDKSKLTDAIKNFRPHKIINLAAQAGVRYSITHPDVYAKSNLEGFLNILEACRHQGVEHLVYASSSSVYGANRKLPFSIHDNIDHPLSLYAATKKANELMAHTYSHLYGLPTTGLRFFTVYGPWGRPDMSAYIFTKAILENQPINVFNHGHHKRDFTYVDDIVEGVVRVCDRVAQPNPNWSGEHPDPGTSFAPYRVYNIGNNSPVELMTMITTLEELLGKEAKKNFLPMQAGDVPETFADVADLERDVGFKPMTSIQEGLKKFVDWYKTWTAI